jgi:hypothetical protein
VSARCIAVCGARAVHRHHAVYEQVVRREGGDLRDPRNLVPVCFACHAAHHNRQRPLPLHVLPDSVFVFARELLGGGQAHVELSRRYVGDDPRLDALLEDAA